VEPVGSGLLWPLAMSALDGIAETALPIGQRAGRAGLASESLP